MEYGVSSYVWVSPFTDETLSQLQHAKDIGFDIYEVAVENPDLINAELLKRTADEVGIKIYICGAFGETRDIGSTKEEYRNNGVRYIKDLIDLAEAVESPIVSGPMYSATGRTELLNDSEKKKQRSLVVENLIEVSEYGLKKGVKLAIEPLNRFETDMINTTQQGIELIAEVNRENVGLLLDTFHMNIEEKNIREAIKLSKGRLFNFHASANDRGTPGEDHFDWDEIFFTLNEIDYDGPMTIESFTQDIVEIARAVSLWRPLANSQDDLATNGLSFLKNKERGSKNEEN